MIEVDINKLNDLLAAYDNYLKQLDKNNLEIITEFNEIRNFWHDQKCINMYSSFELEKKRIIRNAENIKKQEKVYSYIVQKYKKYGQQLRLNMTRVDNVIDKMNEVIKDLKWMIDRYENLGYIDFYPRAYLIRQQRKSLSHILSSYEDMKDDFVTKKNDIKEIENSIQEMASANNIENFSYNNYESEV